MIIHFPTPIITYTYFHIQIFLNAILKILSSLKRNVTFISYIFYEYKCQKKNDINLLFWYLAILNH